MPATVANIGSCYGCGACAAVCPKTCIHLGLSSEGFFVPQVDSTACVHCGACADICLKLNPPRLENRTPLTAESAKLLDKQQLYQASSGGAVFAIAQTGHFGCFSGVNYVPQRLSAQRFVANDLASFLNGAGSKYLQSNADTEVLKQILQTRDERTLLVGTPCQIAGFRRILRRTRQETRFLLVDFWCHSVPSYRLWLAFLRAHVPASERTSTMACWRDKTFGWRVGETMVLKKKGGEELYRRAVGQNDLFYHHYLRYSATNQCCFECPFRGGCSEADIRVGDYWSDCFRNEKEGISRVLALTERGRDAWNQARSLCETAPIPQEDQRKFLDTSHRKVRPIWQRTRGLFLKLLPLPFGLHLAHFWSCTLRALGRVLPILDR
ncbi:MAG: Coenzyme F420 hydrogenase/dehydrogenase, beta subunit C-terminal domain [Victivallales bacterium]|nr:Coenzyme F420 hydrogenase/dehydrogenase, beta subunit C-terminal domain [Victivallales bacterium]